MDYGPPPLCLTPFTSYKKHRQPINKHLHESLNIPIITQNKMILCYIKQIEQILGWCDPKRQPNLYPNGFQREQRQGDIRIKQCAARLGPTCF